MSAQSYALLSEPRQLHGKSGSLWRSEALTKVTFECAQCGGVGTRERGQLNRLAKKGAAPFCSLSCASKARKLSKPPLGWHAARFIERPSAVHTNCTECGVDMWLPPSKAGLYKRCSEGCNEAWRERSKRAVVIKGARVALDRPCETCGIVFRPRPNQVRSGQGRFCSQKCNMAGRAALNKPEVKRLAKERVKEMREAGLIKMPVGPENKQWKGGPKASAARRIASGKAAETLRKYRQNNPDKVKEFSQRRAGRKLDKLPYGTLPKLREAQGDKCAICGAKLNGKGHLDHIVPLAKGGEHKPRNLQFLCPPCNLHKSDRDPIAHMQSLGRLL